MIDATAEYFGIRRTENGEDRITPRGLKRIKRIGFIGAYLLVNGISQTVLGASQANFILPTGLSTNRLVFVTFLFTLLYMQLDVENLQDIDKRYGLGWYYVPERDTLLGGEP